MDQAYKIFTLFSNKSILRQVLILEHPAKTCFINNILNRCFTKLQIGIPQILPCMKITVP